MNSHNCNAAFYETPQHKMGQIYVQNVSLLFFMVGKHSWEESYTLIEIAEENIHAQSIIYSCLASHDKRQEAQQLKGGEEISSFHEVQIVWNQTWFIFRGGNVKMFEQGTVPQSDDSFLRHKVLLRSRLERQNNSFFSKLKKGASSPLIRIIYLSALFHFEHTDSDLVIAAFSSFRSGTGTLHSISHNSLVGVYRMSSAGGKTINGPNLFHCVCGSFFRLLTAKSLFMEL